MEHKIINTGNYLLIVDDSEIKEGDWLYGYMNNNTFQANKLAHLYINSKKIIAHLPLNNSSRLEGVVLLPPLEDEVEKLANEEFRGSFFVDLGLDIAPAYREGFVVGYNKAKEKYIDVIKHIESLCDNQNETHEAIWRICYESLQQPKIPVVFECEIQHYYHDVSFVQCTKEQYDSIKKEIPSCPLKKEIKTTTNSQGLTQWVGEWN